MAALGRCLVMRGFGGDDDHAAMELGSDGVCLQ